MESTVSAEKKKDVRYKREDLSTMMAEKYSKFCKLKCNVCDILCTKGFKGKSSMIAQSMRDTWWCKVPPSSPDECLTLTLTPS